MCSRLISLLFGFWLAPELMPGQVFADHRPNNIAVMGGSWSVTGKYLGAGDSFLKGRELYVEQLNARGGLLGHRVELKILDDKSERRNAIKLYDEAHHGNLGRHCPGTVYQSHSRRCGECHGTP